MLDKHTALYADAPRLDAALDAFETIVANLGKPAGHDLAGRDGASHDLAGSARKEYAAALEARLSEVRSATARLVLLEGQLVNAIAVDGQWAAYGDRNLSAFLGRTSKQGARASSMIVRRANVLTQLPRVAEDLRSGAITVEHADVLARTLDTASNEVANAIRTPEGQAALLGTARAVDGAQFRRHADQWVASVDPERRQRDHDTQRRNRSVSISVTENGCRFTGYLDTISGNRLRLALEAVSTRPTQDDNRTREQRLADAFVEMADRTLANRNTKAGALIGPQVNVVFSEQTWTALRTARTTASSGTCAGTDAEVEAGAELGIDAGVRASAENLVRGGASDLASRLTGVPPVYDLGGIVMPPSEVGRILCDCELTRIVVNAQEVPINLGKTERLYKNEQRHAILARDRECAWNGCDIPARWCQIHHIEWFDRDDGATSIENGIALCSYHHGQVHERDLTMTRVASTQPGAPALKRPFDSVGYVIADRRNKVVSDTRVPVSGRRVLVTDTRVPASNTRVPVSGTAA